jgi:hypothetical protein
MPTSHVYKPCDLQNSLDIDADGSMSRSDDKRERHNAPASAVTAAEGEGWMYYLLSRARFAMGRPTRKLNLHAAAVGKRACIIRCVLSPGEMPIHIH